MKNRSDTMATILILDDRATNREFLLTLLGYTGHTLLEATDAETALAIIRTARPDLVIADVLMPEIDGFEFVRRIRGEPAIAHTRVIFYTATYMESETRALAATLGIVHLLTKPSEPSIILNTVQAALDEPAINIAPPPAEIFEQEHQRLLLDKLAQKVDELEALNAELEQRVAARTAELATANARLEELNHVKDEVLVIASHDMRSPLSAVLLMTELLMEEGDEIPAAQWNHFLTNINAATRHLLGLISDLLDLTKIEAGQIELECSELRASDLVRRVVDALSFNARAKGIDIQLVVAPGEPLLLADRLKLSQVWHNLLSNAIKFTPVGGWVRASVEPEPDGVRVSVADSGLGMAPQDIQHVFEKFKRVHLQGTAGEKGSGLGLAIVQQLVQLHGGMVEVASEVGRGSTFVVHLPRRPLRREYG
jgi:signal transduction histidine kinase